MVHPSSEGVAAQYRQGLVVDARAAEAVNCLLTTSRRRKGVGKQLLRFPCMIDDLLPYMRLVMQEMASRSEALAADGSCSWQHVWKPLSMHGYDTLKNGMTRIDYGNKEYSTVLAVFAALDPEIMLCLEQMTRFWPTVSPRAPYTNGVRAPRRRA